MRILYLSHSTLPSLAANGVHVIKMCQALVQEGHAVELHAVAGRCVGLGTGEHATGGHGTGGHGDGGPSGPRRADADDIRAFYGCTESFPIIAHRRYPWMREMDYPLRVAARALWTRPDLVWTRDERAAAITSTLGLPTVCEMHEAPLRGRSFKRFLRGRGARATVVISEALRVDLAERLAVDLPPERCVVAPDGVDLERFADLPEPQAARGALAAEVGLAPERFTAVYAGHLYAGRGIDLILELAKALPDLAFLVVGGAPERVAAYRAHAAEASLDNIRFTGFVPNRALPRYLAAGDALLMPYQRSVAVSGGNDTARWMSPLKMFEYMAAGRLILSSDHPVLREVLSSENAVLLPPEDLDGWRAALERARSEPAWRGALARQARRDVERYTWRRRCRRVLASCDTAPTGARPSQPGPSQSPAPVSDPRPETEHGAIQGAMDGVIAEATTEATTEAARVSAEPLRPLRIVHMVCDTLPPGGFQYAVHHFANRLADRGHEVILLARRGLPWLPTSITDSEPTRYRVERYFLPPIRGHGHAWCGRRAIRSLTDRFHPDILHGTMGWPCPYWGLDATPTGYRGLVAHFQGADIQVNPEYDYGMRLFPERDREIRRVARECPNIVTISSVMREELIGIGAPPRRVTVIPNGVETGLYAGAPPPPPAALAGRPYMLSMGRLIQKKGYDLLLEAYAYFRERIKEPALLCIAGTGRDAEALQARIAALGLGEEVRLLGFVRGAEKIAWFRHARFYVHPARREPFGIVNAEALAAGKGIVAFGVDGHLDIVRDGVNGYLAPPYDLEAFGVAMARLWTDAALRRRINAAALESAARYDWSRLAGDLEAYYRRILAGGEGA